MKKLGNLIYRKELGPFEVRYPNDDNGHMNNSDYFKFCEKLRKDFLNYFNWSDKWFNHQGFAFNVAGFKEARYRLPLKNGDYFKVNFEVSEGREPLFYIYFGFNNYKGQCVFETQSFNAFVNIEKEKPGIIPVPEFFYSALKE